MQTAKLYLKLILAGRKTFDEVPQNYKAAVKTLLEEKSKNGDKIDTFYFEKFFGE